MENNKLKSILKHFKTVCKHKYWVGYYCFKFGLFKQGILHDMSKFSPKEFIPSVKYYSGKRSPIDAEKEEKGYSLGWAHHHNKNPHHWLYWVDFDKENNVTPMRIPYKYAIEALADWLGASRTYVGKDNLFENVYRYYRKNTRVGSDQNIHPHTKQLWDTILVDFMIHGLDHTSSLIRSGWYEQIYTNPIKLDGKILTHNLVDYNILKEKYYKD